MNILLIVDDFAGGAGNIVQILAIELASYGNSVTIYLTSQRSEPRYRLKDIEVVDAAWEQMQGNWFSIQRQRIRNIRKVVVDKNIQLVISFVDNNNTMACLALWNRKIPLIVSERSNPLEVYPKFPWNYIRRIAYRRADLIAVQFEAFRVFEKRRFWKKCMAIPNIVTQSEFKKEVDFCKDPSFVSLGRNHEIKRFPLLISMFSEFLEMVPDASLHLYGTGVCSEMLQKLVKERRVEAHIFLHEATADVYETLIKHDVYLMTSWQEGFPNALCEAMACGLPIVAFRCHDGISDLVQDGQNGFCVPQDDKNTFIAYMKMLSESVEMRRSMGAKSMEIAKIYDKDKVMKVWLFGMQCVLEKYENKKDKAI